MPTPTPTHSLAAALALALAACAASPEEPQGCETSAQCPSAARCVARACVTNTAPIPSIALPAGALETARLLTFDGSASRDSDTGDAIASRAWSFQTISAPCAAPSVAGGESTAAVRFGCPGTYAVELTVTDQLGASAATSREFEVAPYSGTPLLVVAPDVVVGHRCASGRCTTTDVVALSAVPTAAAPAGLSLRWTVEPPAGRELGAHRRVGFSPGPDAPSPEVSIETDGQAISGDWIFRVEARDGGWVVATGAIRVSVGNSPPVLTRTLGVAGHRYEGGQFISENVIPFDVTDPDGDELLPPAVEWRHAGDGPNGFFHGTVAASPSRVTYAIRVPYAAPSDAAYLIGGAGLERTIRFSVSDVNEGSVAEDWPILVGNRPPALVAAASSGVSVNHSFDASTSAYVAVVPLSTWSDPDGDPLFQLARSATGDPACAAFEVVGGVATVHCSVRFEGAPAVQALAGPHTVRQHVQDPWDPAAQESVASFTILNRAPVLVASPIVAATTCTTGGCCQQNYTDQGYECIAWTRSFAPASTTISGRWVDDDGDPLEVAVTGAARTVCTPATCSVRLEFGETSACAWLQNFNQYTDAIGTSATDGLALTTGAFPRRLTCP